MIFKQLTEDRQERAGEVTTDQASELDVLHAYNAAIRLAQEADDQATADLLRKILLMEEGHVEWAEQQSDQIEQMGLANYLTNQAAP